jgi:hypothetical protein
MDPTRAIRRTVWLSFGWSVAITNADTYRSAQRALHLTNPGRSKQNCQTSAGLQKNVEPLSANAAQNGNPKHRRDGSSDQKPSQAMVHGVNVSDS